MIENYSNSRLKCFHTCKLKYYLQYIKKFDSSDTSKSAVTEKGLAFHETAENFYTGISDADAISLMDSKIKEHNIKNLDTIKFNENGYALDDNGQVILDKDGNPCTRDTIPDAYPMYSALRRLKYFWENFVAKKEQEGYKVKKEEEFRGEIEGKSFMGYLDLFLDKGDEVIIGDYKTPKTINASSYKEQLMLYAYLVGKQRGWNEDEIEKRIKLYVFFPFGDHKKEGLTEVEDALACLKQVKYTAFDLRDVIQTFYINSIKEAETFDWSQVSGYSGKYNQWTCKWCQYLGALPIEAIGFPGCQASRMNGVYQKRGVTFTERVRKDNNAEKENPEK